jgi:hypothetical protein
MAKTWGELSQLPDFQSLSREEQEMARTIYFDKHIAPGVDPEALPKARAKYDERTLNRTWGEAFSDTGKQLVEGGINIATAIPALIAPGSDFVKAGNTEAEAWRESQSPTMKAKSAAAERAVEEAGKEGFWSQTGEALSQYGTDPALASRLVATNLASLIPGLGSAKAAQMASMARAARAAKTAGVALDTTEAAQRAAKMAMIAGGTTNAALNAGGARGEAYQDIYKTLIEKGYDQDQAGQIALGQSVLPAAVGAATGALSGSQGLERALLGPALKGGVARRFAAGTGKELGTEMLEEGAPKVTTNWQAGEYDQRPLTQDLGTTLVQTAIGAGPTSLASGAAAAMRAPEAVPPVAEQTTQPATEPEAPPVLDTAAPPPIPVVGPLSAAAQAGQEATQAGAPVLPLPPAPDPAMAQQESDKAQQQAEQAALKQQQAALKQQQAAQVAALKIKQEQLKVNQAEQKLGVGPTQFDEPNLLAQAQGLAALSQPTIDQPTQETTNGLQTETYAQVPGQVPGQTPNAANAPASAVAPTAQTPVTERKPDPTPQNQVDTLQTVEVPLASLQLSRDVPQFKQGADDQGVVEPLGGKQYDRTGTAPIQVWERLDGRLEVISGRHRFDLARRTGETSIPAQIHREADGFDKLRAQSLDAILNIRDGQGKVIDYVDYFKTNNINPTEAQAAGLVARNPGKRSYAIAARGGETLIAQIRAGAITDTAAEDIANAAPGDDALQAVALDQINKGRTKEQAIATLHAVKSLASPGQGGEQVDLFGFDDSQMRAAERMGAIAARKQREIGADISAISGAAKNPALAKKYGVEVNDPESLKAAQARLKAEKEAWNNWSTNQDLVAQVRAEAGVTEDQPALVLQPESEADLRAKDAAAKAQQQAADQADAEAAAKQQADLEVDGFQLNSANIDPNQASLFSNKAAPTEDLAHVEAFNKAIVKLNASKREATPRASIRLATAADLPPTGRVARRLASAVAATFGHRVIYVASADNKTTLSFDGSVSPNDPTQILIANDAEAPITRVVAHEVLHGLKRVAPDIYDNMLGGLRQVYDPQQVARHTEQRGYQGGLNESNEEEWVADFFSNTLHDPQSLAKLALAMDLKKTGSGLEFLNNLKEFIGRILAKLRGDPVIGQGFEGADAAVKELEQARDVVVKAITEYARARLTGKTAETLATAPLSKRKPSTTLRKPGSDIGHKRESTGRYVGAPAWIGGSSAKLGQLRQTLKKLAIEGEKGRYWYERSSRAILKIAQGDKDKAEVLVKLIAIYSPANKVPHNATAALKAYYQWLEGLPIRVGLGMLDKKANEMLYQGKEWEGIKTNNFYYNLMEEIDPARNLQDAATMDMWMAIAFDYGMKTVGQAAYPFMHAETIELAKRLGNGWKPHQVQAAIWTAIKGRVEAILDELMAASIKNGWHDPARVANKKGEYSRETLATEHRSKYYQLAFKMGMAHKLTQDEINAASYDFRNAFDDRLAQLSWEAVPGESTGVLPGIHKATMAERLEYEAAIINALTDDRGRDRINLFTGVLDLDRTRGFSGWQGKGTPGVQEAIAVAAPSGAVSDSTRLAINLAADIRGLVLAQEGVAWHYPHYTASGGNLNGSEIDLGRNLTAEENDAFYAALIEELGHDMAPPIPRVDGRGVRILNFPDEKFALMDDFSDGPDLLGNTGAQRKKALKAAQLKQNRAFFDGVTKAIARQSWKAEVVTKTSFQSDGELRENNWNPEPVERDPNDPLQDTSRRSNDADYRDRIVGAVAQRVGNSGAGSPDLQKRFTDELDKTTKFIDGLRKDIHAVNADFAKRKGWGGPQTFIPFSLRPNAARDERAGTGAEAQGRPSYGRARPGAVKSTGVHYSRASRETLDSSKYGTGIQGEEARRVANADDQRLRHRIYFYVSSGKGVTPEPGVGGYAHTVDLNNLYDLDADPQYLVPKDVSLLEDVMNGFESAVIDAGFDGYVADFAGQRAAVLLGPQQVPVQYEGLAVRPQVPAGERAPTNPIKRIGALLRTPWVKQTPKAFGEQLKAADPELYRPFADQLTATDKTYWPGEMARQLVPPETPRLVFSNRATVQEENLAKREFGAVVRQFTNSDGSKKEGWLKAPNGRPSNLDNRQWVQVRTPSFINWFGPWLEYAERPGGVWNDEAGRVSKVVDVNGEPMVVYHGSQGAGFTVLDPTKSDETRSAMVFTAKTSETAATYAGTKNEAKMAAFAPTRAGLEIAGYEFRQDDKEERPTWWTVTDPEGNDNYVTSLDAAIALAAKDFDQNNSDYAPDQAPGVYSLFLNIRDPYERDFGGANWDGQQLGGWFSIWDSENAEYVEESDAVLLTEGDAERLYEELGGDEVEYDGRPRYEIQEAPELGETTNSVSEEALSFGNDGAMIHNVVDDGGQGLRYYQAEPDTVMVFFKANQAKSATQNTGEFSTNNDDLRFSNRQTQTPAFKKWFADSKVVDKDGSPLVVYHGSPDGRFLKSSGVFMGAADRFGEQRGVGVFWFSKDRGTAASYADDRRAWDYQNAESEVLPAYLKLENPLIIDGAGQEWRDAQAIGKTTDVLEKAQADGHDGVVIKNVRDDYNNGPRTKATDTYAVFDSRQIKSAVGNRGSFDAANPDIRFSNRPTPEGKPAPPAETRRRKIQRFVQDKFNRWQVIQDWLKEHGVNLSDTADVVKAEERFHSRVANQIEDFRRDVLKPLQEKTHKSGFTNADIAQFLHAQMAEKRNIDVAAKNPRFPDGGSGMDTQEARTILAAAPPELKKIANEWRQIAEGTLDLQVSSGLTPQERADAFRAANPDYVPLRGGPEDQRLVGTGKGYKVRHKDLRALGHPVRPGGEWIIENLLAMREQVIMKAEKALLAKHVLQMAVEMQRPDLISVNEPQKRQVLKNNVSYLVTYRGSPVEAFTTLEAARVFRQMAGTQKGNTVIDFDIVRSSTPEVTLMASPMLADNELMAYVAGHEIRMQLNDDLLARAYGNLGAEGLGAVLQAGRTLNTWLSKVYTGYNPEFIFVNVIRDFITGLANLTGEQGAMMAVRAAQRYPKSFKDLLKYAIDPAKATQSIKDYREDGGNTGAAYLDDMERIGGNLATEYAKLQGVVKNLRERNVRGAAAAGIARPIQFLVAWIEKLNIAGENAMRLAIYQAMRDSGKGRAAAASAAKNTTVNFNRKGEMGLQLNAMWLFFNAAVQGTSAIAHSHFKGANKGQAWAFSGSVIGLSYLASLMAAGDDEEDDKYESVGEYERSRNVLIRTENGFAKIPVPYGYGFFHNLGRALADLQRTGEMGKLPWHLASGFIEEFTPFGSMVAGKGPDSQQALTFMGPTAWQIFAVPALNRTSFGTPLYPEKPWQKAEFARDQYWRGTGGTWADTLAGALEQTGLDVSPESLKHLWRTATGGAGTAVTDTASMVALGAQGAVTEPKETPFLRKLYTVPGVQDARARYYESLEEARIAKETLKRYKDKGSFEEAETYQGKNAAMIAMADVGAKLAKRIEKRRDAYDAVRKDETLPIAEKRRQLREMEVEEIQIYNDYVRLFQERTRKAP